MYIKLKFLIVIQIAVLKGFFYKKNEGHISVYISVFKRINACICRLILVHIIPGPSNYQLYYVSRLVNKHNILSSHKL